MSKSPKPQYQFAAPPRRNQGCSGSAARSLLFPIPAGRLAFVGVGRAGVQTGAMLAPVDQRATLIAPLRSLVAKAAAAGDPLSRRCGSSKLILICAGAMEVRLTVPG
jgi:hypothetical protein